MALTEHMRTSRAREEEREHQALLDSLRCTRGEIHRAYAGFNATSDPDLIESYVFEIKALQSRYSYLLRRVKALEGVL
ncbi:MAG: DUF2508 family protein [Oscillospiraceae bacterium]|nr:DUF2508 family protein [Oscillospiraceae bacterium]